MHEENIGRALALAAKALLLSQPNPRVGCVLVDATGETIGLGSTQKAGGAHAEVRAIQNAAERGFSTNGATAYVTLEPCSHHGRTGPCCDALIDAGIKKVVASIADPNPSVSGRGFERLRAAGIEVIVGPGGQHSRDLNIGFFSRMIRKTPWVRMKVAASLDGKTALQNGKSQWITSTEARTDGHFWRAKSCAVLTGIGTVLEDNPKLDVRLVDTPRQPHLVVVDSQMQTPIDANLFIEGRKLFIYTSVMNETKKSALEAKGATVVYMPMDSQTTFSKVDLRAMLCDLAKREVNELHVEAGSKLNGSFIREGLVDEFLVYLAPKMLGQGKDMALFGPLTDLSQARQLDFLSTEVVGPDLRIVARVAGRDAF